MLNSLYFLLSITSFCGISLYVNQKFKINFWFSLIFSISIIVFSLFIFGIISLLSEIVIVLNLVGIFSFFYFVFKNKNWLTFNNFKVCFLPIFLLISWFIISNFLFIKEWDEFYWGQFVKSIFYEKQLWNIDSSVINARYLPGASLFQVYFIYFNNTYNENTVIFASGLIFFISIFCLFNLKSYLSNILIFTLILLFVFFFERMPGTLYLEIYLASLFFIYFYYLIFYLNTKNQFFLYPILIFSLVLFKTHGLFLSFIILVIFYFKMINRREIFFKIFPEIFSILILIGIFLLNKMWSYHLQRNYLDDFIGYLSFAGIYKLIYKDFFENNFFILKELLQNLSSAEVLNNKGRQLFYEINNFIPSLMTYFFLIFGFNFCLNLKKNKYQNFLRILFYFGFFAYLFLPYLFMLYMQETGSDEGFSAAYRFTKIYLLSLTFLLIFEFIMFVKEKKVLKNFSYLLSFFIIVFTSLFYEKINYYSQIVLQRIEEQKAFNIRHISLTQNLKKFLTSNDRVFYINYSSNGYDAMSFRYHLSPIKSDNFDWSIGPKFNKDDIWTRSYNSDQFKAALNYDRMYLEKLKYIKNTKNLSSSDINIVKKYYTHIYIERAHEQFYKDNRDIFKNKNYPKENLLFRIKRNKNDEIILLENLNFNY